MRVQNLVVLIFALIAAAFAYDMDALRAHGVKSSQFFEERKQMMMRENAKIRALTGMEVSPLGMDKGVEGVYGVDFSTALSASTLECISKKLGSAHTFAIPRGFRSSNSVDPNILTNLANAWGSGVSKKKSVMEELFSGMDLEALGMTEEQLNLSQEESVDFTGTFTHVDMYMFPSPKSSTSGENQVGTLYNKVKNAKFGMLWLDIEGSDTYWHTDKGTNANFFKSLLSGCAKYGFKCGIYASKNSWSSIMGRDTDLASSYPLWYPHYDNKPNFSDWVPSSVGEYGGWKAPNIKQYKGTTSMCGGGVDLNVY